MQELKKTTPGPDGHYHIVYLDTVTGASAMSPATDGHTHIVSFVPGTEPVQPSAGQAPAVDPNTGDPVLDVNGQPDQGVPASNGDPGTPESWIIQPASMNPQAAQQALPPPGAQTQNNPVQTLAPSPGAPPAQDQNQAVQMSAPAQPTQAQSASMQSASTPMQAAPQTPTMIAPAGQPQAPIAPIVSDPTIHTHELVDIATSPTEKKEKEEDTIKECIALWREALEITEDSRKKGREAEDFYQGKQWEEHVKRALEGLDRAALTINEIAPNVDTLIGYQMQQRTDIRYLPNENGDQRVADMLNIIVKKLTDACYYPREETKVFKDQIVPGMGAFNVYMNFNDNIQGDIQIERFPWDDIVYGPHEKEDLSDCEYEVRSRMYSIAKLKQMFGSKAEEIETSYKNYAGQYPDIEAKRDPTDGLHTDYRTARKIDDVPYTIDGTFPLIDIQKKQFRFAQCTRKIYKEVTVIFNQEENFFYTAYDWKEKDVAFASTIPGFQVLSQIKTRMRITRFCGSVVLSDENPADLPLHDFYTVPVYGYRQNGEFWGRVETAKDPQREINKRRSQMMDMINRLGAAVYYTDDETFKDNNELERFKKNRSKPGSMFKLSNINNRPLLDEGAEPPAALIQIMQLDQQNLQRLMNIIAAQPSANESGAMFTEKQNAKTVANQFFFDNLSFAKQKLGKIILSLVQRYYTPERLLRLLDSQYLRQKFKVGGDDYYNYTREEVEELLGTLDLIDYDVIVADSAFSATTRLGIAKMLFDLMKQGAEINPAIALKFVDMPQDLKNEIDEDLQQQTQQSVETATNTSNTEIIKTLLAKGQYTVAPEKAQELGLVPATPKSALANSAKSVNNAADQSRAMELANNLAGPLAGG